MKDEYGNIKSKIWLIGDSPPSRWEDKLAYPLDIRHPAVHNIWTPILNKINAALFDKCLRLNEKTLYIRNAVDSASFWDNLFLSNAKLNKIWHLINDANPIIIITFGSRAFAAVSQESPIQNGKLLQFSSRELGEYFKTAIKDFDVTGTNILPLLHVSVSRGKFLEAQADFCGYAREEYRGEFEKDDYFSYTGKRIAEVLMQKYPLCLEQPK